MAESAHTSAKEHSPINPHLRILVVANETLEGELLRQTVLAHAARGVAEVLVVAPGGPEGSEERLERTLARLERDGVYAFGWIGHPDPLAAIAGALAVYEADQIVIATHPEFRSNWLMGDVISTARRRFGVPVAHVVVHGRGTPVSLAA